MEKKLTKPQLDGYYMPAEFGRHDGTIMIYPTRPGSWGVDRSGALDSFGKIFLEIIKRENLYLLADKSHYDEAIEFMDEIQEDMKKYFRIILSQKKLPGKKVRRQ